MTRTPPQDCPHPDVRPRGMLAEVPPGWHPLPPAGGNDVETAWCRTCERYLWRLFGGVQWTALNRPG